MRGRFFIIILFVLLLAATILVTTALVDWRAPKEGGLPPLSEAELRQELQSGNVAAIWYNVDQHRLYGRYDNGEDLNRGIEDADFVVDMPREDFDALAAMLESKSGGLSVQNGAVLGYVKDSQSVWQRYREYWIFSVCLVLVATAFVFWLRHTWKRKTSDDDGSRSL